jgi:putative transposase
LSLTPYKWPPGNANQPKAELWRIPITDRSVYTSWLFGNRLRDAGLLGSMGTTGDCYDNSVAEAFFSILQRELLDQHQWTTRDQLAGAIFDWIETWYNPKRRHSYNHGLSPLDYETANAA